METLIEVGKFIALFVGLTAFVYICGTVIAGLIFRYGEKKSDREIKELDRKIRENKSE